MRAEEKEVADHELARETRTEEVREEQTEEQLPELEATTDLAAAHQSEIVAMIRAMFAGDVVQFSTFDLPQREHAALAYLQAAVTGKDPRYQKFAFADDRRDMLEQALAVLEPILGDRVVELEDITQHVAELRERLTNLEDAQDELMLDDKALEKATVDVGDKPIPLDGDPLPAIAKPASSLTGNDLPKTEKPPTSLTGPELPEAQTSRKKPSALVDGPAIEPEPKGTTTLVDPDDPPSKVPKGTTPWWRRPFG